MRKSIAAIAGMLMLLIMPELVSAQDTFYPGGYYNSIGGMNPVGHISIDTIHAAGNSNITRLASSIPANVTTPVLLTTFAGQPDVARNVIVTPSGAVTGSLKITGVNIAGSAFNETVSWSNSSTAKSTTGAFKTVTKIEGTFTQSTLQTLDIGTGTALGLNTMLPYNTSLLVAVGGAKASATISTNAAVLAENTVTVSSPGGSDVVVYYIV
jgi:hypothetical protein